MEVRSWMTPKARELREGKSSRKKRFFKRQKHSSKLRDCHSHNYHKWTRKAIARSHFRLGHGKFIQSYAGRVAPGQLKTSKNRLMLTMTYLQVTCRRTPLKLTRWMSHVFWNSVSGRRIHRLEARRCGHDVSPGIYHVRSSLIPGTSSRTHKRSGHPPYPGAMSVSYSCTILFSAVNLSLSQL